MTDRKEGRPPMETGATDVRGEADAPADSAASGAGPPPPRPLWAGALLRPASQAPTPRNARSPLELLRATAPEDDLPSPADGDWRRGGLVTRSRLKAAGEPPRAWDEIGAAVSATQILRNPLAPLTQHTDGHGDGAAEGGPDDTLTDAPAPQAPDASPSASPAPRFAPLPFDADGRRLGSAWLLHYARRKATGRLTLTRRGTTARVQFDHGRVVRVRLVPERPEESLGRLLVDRGLLTAAAAERARAYAEEASCLFGVAALRTTDVAPHAIVKALLGRLKGRLKTLAVEPPEGVSFEPLAVPDKGAIPAGVAVETLVFDALVRRYAGRAPRAMAAQEAELAGHFVVKQDALGAPAKAAALDPDERALWDALGDEPRALRDVNRSSPLSPRRTHATLFALRDMGYLAFEVQPPRSRGAERYEALLRRDPAAPGASASPFDVLGAHWSADGPGLEALYEQRRAALRRARPRGPLGPQVLALEAAVAANLEAAMDTLRSADARRAARRAVASVQQIAQAAEHYVRQGDMAVFRGDSATAAEDYRRALDLIPRHPDATRKLAKVTSPRR